MSNRKIQMKKLLVTLLILPLLTGCYAFRTGIPIFNNHGYHYTPDSVEVQKGDTLYSLSKNQEDNSLILQALSLVI